MKKLLKKIGVLGAMFAGLLAAPEVLAGTEGVDAFGTAYYQVVDWTQGYLGKLIGLGFLLVGIFGLARGGAGAIITGFAGLFFILMAPSIVDGVLTAVA